MATFGNEALETALAESEHPGSSRQNAGSHSTRNREAPEKVAEPRLAVADKNHDGDADEDDDGEAQFDRAAERRLRLKIDLYVVPTVAILVISIFYSSYILFEIPSSLLCKWMGPGWFLPLATIMFGVASLASGFANNYAQMAAVRFLLGISEAGMLPGCAYYLSRWYRSSELVFRLALYIITAPLAGAFAGVLASSILKLDSFGGVRKWRMIFAIEGIMTICLGLVALFTLTDRPETARWLTREEKDLAVRRVKSERVGQTVVLDRIDKKKLLRGIFSPVTLSTGFIFLCVNITVQSLSFFLPTIVRTIYGHKSVVEQQLLTAPPYLVAAVLTLLFPLLSWRLDKRQVFIILSAPLVMVGFCMFLGSEASAVRYAATFLIAASAFTNGAMCNAQASANVVSDTARSAAIGTNVMLGNIGGLISGWAFLPWDAPNYHVGNGLNLAAASSILVVGLLTQFWMQRDNRRRTGRDVEGALRGLTQQEIEDLDWKHPAFRWKP
ncbi:hypothetical protein UVI_02042780 [Ustilaginoidea virens]|uniref:Major facilitator superfamily (MFS) profile domain-containing protein n=1 Tax=Ustilaginoidea virens TaxID=1159556 RepID=A0A1B5L3N1_USTVR|nr:hypothetical protein UVI_02042780 [Ustilaginoidea virens]